MLPQQVENPWAFSVSLFSSLEDTELDKLSLRDHNTRWLGPSFHVRGIISMSYNAGRNKIMSV